MVELHHDVRTEDQLEVDHGFRRHRPAAAVDMRGECYAVLSHRVVVGQAEYLEAATVGQDRSIPAHERVDATSFTNHIDAGTKHQVIGICQDDLRSRAANFIRLEGLHRGLGADGHEYRCLNHAMHG